MTGLQGKQWFFFIWDEDNEEHLWRHGISPKEAEDVFYNDYIITPNKKRYPINRYKIDGVTNHGRKLRIIFEDFGNNIARIITGWDR